MDNMIGLRIKERRRALNITGAQIKEKTGISPGNLSDIENGKSLPSALATIQLSQILECSTDYILIGGLPSPEASKNSNIRTEQLVSLFNNMSEEDQDELLLIAQMKANKGKRTQNIKSSLSAGDRTA